MSHPLPTEAEALAYLTEQTNWDRWGESTELGAFNMLTPDRVIAGARAVRQGKRVPLARTFPTEPKVDNPEPSHHYMKRRDWEHHSGPSGVAVDYYGSSYHGLSSTHLDALCHTWAFGKLWGGKNPDDVLTFNGATWGGVELWKDGFITRGVLFDVPGHRGVSYVDVDEPIHGGELEEIAKARNLAVQPGDAVLVYGGRDAWSAAHGEQWGTGPARPGLHMSCLPYLRKSDCCLLVWDMMEVLPSGYDLPPYPVHKVISSYGIALVDNAYLAGLAEACREYDQYDFQLIVAPLVVPGGTGSPVNPIAVL
jgi:kynurenine formamidase